MRPYLRRIGSWSAAVLGVVVLIALVAWVVISVANHADRLAIAETGLQANAERLEQLGVEPPATPEPESDPEEDSTRRVTEEQVRTIVASELAGLDLTDEQITEIARLASTLVPPGSPGERGRQGEPGGPPSEDLLRELVTDAVGQVCADGGCQGPPGEPGPAVTGAPGPQGEPGADSTVPGPQGEPGAQGVQGEPGQPGVDGSDGTDGQDGADGRGVVSLDIEGDGIESCDLVVTYTTGEPDRIPINPMICQMR